MFFYVIITGDLNVNKFSENLKLFLKNMENRFLVQSTSNESAIFSYKTALSKANVKTNSMRSSKWTYKKEQTFAIDSFIVLKI